MFKFNRIYLVLTLVLSLAAPLFFITLPETEIIPVKSRDWEKSLFSEVNVENNLSEEKEIKRVVYTGDKLETKEKGITPISVTTKIEPSKINGFYVFLSICFLISLLLFIRFSFNLFFLFFKITKSKAISYNGFSLIITNKKEPIYSFWSYIFISKEDLRNSFSRKELLSHEIAHLKQKHTLDIILVEIIKSLFWFNPIFYLYKKAIQLNHEFLADEEVLKAEETNVYEYQKLILDSIEVKKTIAIVSNFNYVLTKKRLLMMTKKSNSWRKGIVQIFSIPFILFLLFVFSNKIYTQTYTKDNELTKEQLEKLKKMLVVEDMINHMKDSLAFDSSIYTDTLIIDDKIYVISSSKENLNKILKSENKDELKKISSKDINRIFNTIDAEKINNLFGIRELKEGDIQRLINLSTEGLKNNALVDKEQIEKKVQKQLDLAKEKSSKAEQVIKQVDGDNKVRKEQVEAGKETLDTGGLDEFKAEMKQFKTEMEQFKTEMKQFKKELRSLKNS